METRGSGIEATGAGRREWFGLAVLALPTLLLSLDVSVLYLALPHISADLHANATQQLWILDIYSFVLAGLLVTMGTVGDRIGRRRLLMIGAAAFGGASVLAAFSRSPEMLIGARALLGIAGATLAPSTLALIRNMFKDPAEMGQAVGVWFACFMVGLALGPLVGGILLQNFWWGSVFLLGVPFMALLLVAGPFTLPEYRNANAGVPDILSVAMSLAAILPVIYGLKELARSGWNWIPFVSIAVGMIIGFAFMYRQRHISSALLDVNLFANKLFTSSLATSLLLGVVMAGVSLMATLYLQMVQGLSPLVAGLCLIPQNLVMAAGSMGAPMLARRVRPVVIMATGLLIAASGLMLTTLAGSPEAGATTTVEGVVLMVLGLTVTTAGVSLPMPLMIGMILGSAPPEKAGSAASISETSGELGIALGVAGLGSLATIVYRTQIEGAIPPAVPGWAVGPARESITGAMAVAGQLPSQISTGLVDVSRTAFTTGVHTVAGLGAAVFIGLAILAWVVFHGSEQATPESKQEANELELSTATQG